MTTALGTGVRRVAARLAPADAPDGDLLARFLHDRDEAAFAAVVHRHAAMVFGTCRRVLGNAADADDAFQAAFVVLVRRAAGFTDRACVGNFLYGVAYHTALKAKAMAAKRRLRETKAEPPPAPADDSELLRALDEELAGLPEKYREPVVLCELEGHTRRAVAGRLKVAEGTLSSRLATAHRMLEKRLKARGFAVAGVAALLAAQSPAASPDLAAAAVHAALAGPTGGVTQLVAEVSKMLFLSKLKLGAAVLVGVAMVMAAGVGGVRPGQATAEERPAGKPAEVPKANPPKIVKAEPAWMPAFRTAYQLTDGQYVKRVELPLPAERRDYILSRFPDAAPDDPGAELWNKMGVLFMTADGRDVFYSALVSTDEKDDRKQMGLAAVVEYATGLRAPEVAFDDHAKKQKVSMVSDFVIRKGAPLEKIVPDLEKALRLCDFDGPRTPPTLVLEKEEQDVFVVGGAFKIARREWRNADEVDVYANEAVVRKEFSHRTPDPSAVIHSVWNTGTVEGFVRDVGTFTNTRIVWDADLDKVVKFHWYRHERQPKTATAEERVADHDREAVLKHVSEQTGLTFKKEKRKVTVLKVFVTETK
jgi:RNA polymerase sigma factor (sigma-70 family)